MSDAFDQAWALLKMPVVQGSVYRNYGAEEEDDEDKRYGGAFDDPETGERMNMEAVFDPENRLEGWIDSPPDDTYNLPPRGAATITPDHDPQDPQWSAHGLGVDDDYRRRGYATGLYDFLAYILDRNNRDLTPSNDQTAGGRGLWDSLEESMEDDEKTAERWRIRGDLG